MAGFPAKDFDYGGNGIVSEQVRKIFQSAFLMKNLAWPTFKDYPTGNSSSKLKKLSPQDQSIVNGAANGQQWMTALLNHHSPNTEYDPTAVLKSIAYISPGTQISNSRLWTTTISTLKNAVRDGNSDDWWDGSDSSITKIPSFEDLEALRIYGDSTYGFGNWPTKLTEALNNAGLGWMKVPADARVIPAYWKNHCDSKGIPYKSVSSVQRKEPNNQRKRILTRAAIKIKKEPEDAKPLTSISNYVPSQQHQDLVPLTEHHQMEADTLLQNLNHLPNYWMTNRKNLKNTGLDLKTVDLLKNIKNNQDILIKTFQHQNDQREMTSSLLTNVTNSTLLADPRLQEVIQVVATNLVRDYVPKDILERDYVHKKDIEDYLRKDQLDASLQDLKGDAETVHGHLHESVGDIAEKVFSLEKDVDGLMVEGGHRIKDQKKIKKSYWTDSEAEESEDDRTDFNLLTGGQTGLSKAMSLLKKPRWAAKRKTPPTDYDYDDELTLKQQTISPAPSGVQTRSRKRAHLAKDKPSDKPSFTPVEPNPEGSYFQEDEKEEDDPQDNALHTQEPDPQLPYFQTEDRNSAQKSIEDDPQEDGAA